MTTKTENYIKVVGHYYRVKRDLTYAYINAGDVIELVKDDGDDVPLFHCPKFGNDFDGLKNVTYLHMMYVEYIGETPHGSPVRKIDPIEMKKRNNAGGDEGKCASCGNELSPWGGGLGWYCKKCE